MGKNHISPPGGGRDMVQPIKKKCKLYILLKRRTENHVSKQK
jgi:hypothetical protein